MKDGAKRRNNKERKKVTFETFSPGTGLRLLQMENVA